MQFYVGNTDELLEEVTLVVETQASQLAHRIVDMPGNPPYTRLCIYMQAALDWPHGKPQGVNPGVLEEEEVGVSECVSVTCTHVPSEVGNEQWGVCGFVL